MRSSIRKALSILLLAAMLLAMSGCGTRKETYEPMVLNLFAPKTSVMAVSTIVDRYKSMSEYASIRITYEDSDMLAAMVEAGYACDIIFTDQEYCMDWIDGKCGADKNPNKNDCLVEDTRMDVFKGILETSHTEYDEEDNEIEVTDSQDLTFTVAVVKGTKYEKECKKFLSFLTDERIVEEIEEAGFEMVAQTE